jgi:hypothetical protein
MAFLRKQRGGGRDPHATVIKVDSRGRMKTVAHFDSKVRAVVWLVAGSLLLCAVMGVLYRRESSENARLSAELERTRERNRALRSENERLMARLVIARPASAGEAAPTAAAPPAVTAPGDADAEAPEAAEGPGGPQDPADESAAGEVVFTDAPPSLDVEVGNFEASYQKNGSRLKVTFSLRNTGEVKAEGRSVTVFTSDAPAPDDRISIPRVWLEDGLPRGNRGRRFSIRKFMRVNLEREVDLQGVRFRQAEVFVFADSGALITRQVFPLDLVLPGGPDDGDSGAKGGGAATP